MHPLKMMDAAGTCGIMMAHLTDPLSQFISWLAPTEINAVGFYYPGMCHGTHQTSVSLYSVHNNEPIPWMRLGTTLDRFLGSPFVSMIQFYPSESTGFRTNVVAAMAANSKFQHDLNQCYTRLWLRFAGIPDPGMTITGYTLCNRVLVGSDGSATELMTTTSPIIISARDHSDPTTSEMEYVVMECRPEITRLTAIFIDLFTAHSEFRDGILRLSLGCTQDMSELLKTEEDLVEHVIASLAHGTMSTPTLNDFIAAMSRARCNVGATSLPFCLQSAPKVKMMATEMPFSLSVIQSAPLEYRKREPLAELGAYLEHLSTLSAKSEPITVDLGTIIGLYNRIVSDTRIPEIATGGHSILVDAQVQLSPPTIDVPVGGMIMAIPCHHANFQSFSTAQLYEILVYIDSLRASDGTGDTRFAALMNDITQELALRRMRHKNDRKHIF